MKTAEWPLYHEATGRLPLLRTRYIHGLRLPEAEFCELVQGAVVLDAPRL